jgi:phage I-like protein
MFPGRAAGHHRPMSRTATALCAAISIGEDAGAPEWLHLLPAGEARTADGRGPYRLRDVDAVIQASMAATGGKLVLCENHATDLAAPKGEPAPARGWIDQLQSREDGLWGHVDWTPEGRRIMEAREYRGVSPVIVHQQDGTIDAVLRATLTNTPNLTGLVALHSQENTMDLRMSLIEALGLDGEPDDAAIVAAVKAMKMSGGDKAAKAALQSALSPIALAAGLAADADQAAVLAGVQRLAGGADAQVTSLQSEVATLTTQLGAVETDRKRDKATAYVDAAIAAGRVGVKPKRERYIAMHMRDPAEAEELIGAMPVLVPGELPRGHAPEGQPENPALLSQRAAAYQRKLQADGVTIDFAAAVRAVHEGKTA